MPAQVPGTREAILAAAARAFAEKGYGSTTMTDVRRAAGASTGSLYHHFPSREHLAATVWLDGLAGFQRGFLRTLERAKDAEGGIKGGVRFHIRWVRENPDVARLLLADQDPAVRRVAAERLQARNAEFFGAVRGWLDRHVEAGTVRPLPFDLLHTLWLGPAQELARLWLAGTLRTGADRAARELGESAWLALRAQRPRSRSTTSSSQSSVRISR
jgi:AcrR family transcriptional regulator